MPIVSLSNIGSVGVVPSSFDENRRKCRVPRWSEFEAGVL